MALEVWKKSPFYL